MTTSVVIATKDRPEYLAACLQSLGIQTALPDEVILVDASVNDASLRVTRQMEGSLRGPVTYLKAEILGASQQRNQGVQAAQGDLVIFVDDDAVLEPEFVESLKRCFEEDREGKLAGVGGTIVNQVFTPLSPLNRIAFGVLSGVWTRDLAGRIVGPGVNFLPEDGSEATQPVDWLNTTGTAYRRDAFLKVRFDENVMYPLEDLHLSARIGRGYRLLTSRRARLFHNDQGRRSKRNWKRIGEGMMLSRHSLARYVLRRRGLSLYLPLFGFELGYCTLTMIWNGGQERDWPQVGQVLLGKLTGAWRIITGRPLPPPRMLNDNQ